MEERRQICDGSVPPGLLQIEVKNVEGKSQAGIKITVTWDGGEDVFYTGLAPLLGPGYADFSMTPGISYQIKVGDAGKPVTLTMDPDCLGGYLLEFSGN